MRVKSGLAEMLKGGVIMDVVDAEQAVIAENAGAVAVMARERVPADIRRDGGVARNVRPGHDPRHPGGRLDPRDGEVPDRPLRGGADPSGARGRLHRRVRGPDARRRRAPRRQVGLHDPVRLRRHQPGRGAAAHCRGRGDDPHQGRGRHRRHRQRRHHMRAVFGGHPRLQSLRSEELYAEAKNLQARTSSSAGWPRTAGCPRSPSRPAASQPRRRARSACSSAPTASSSARASSSRATRPEAKAIVEATTHFQDAKIPGEVSTGSVSRWSASPPPRCPTASGSKFAAGRADENARWRRVSRLLLRLPAALCFLRASRDPEAGNLRFAPRSFVCRPAW